jgi:hypothetical protein
MSQPQQNYGKPETANEARWIQSLKAVDRVNADAFFLGKQVMRQDREQAAVKYPPGK